MTAAFDTTWLGLEGRVCAVTGAASGIGKAVAASLARAGASVALLDRNLPGAEAVARALAGVGARAVAIECDTTSQTSVAAAAARAARELGPCTVLVNNAGILRPGGLETLPLADWNTIIAVNLTGYFICAQAFAPQMLAQKKGSLVHIASMAASEPQPYSGAYSVTKAGVAMLSRQLAVEWGPGGIRSNIVSPGLVRTPLSETFYQAPGVTEKRAEMVPRGRVGTPEDIADAVTFLASDRADYVNGAEILTDGGICNVLMSTIPRPGFERPA